MLKILVSIRQMNTVTASLRLSRLNDLNFLVSTLSRLTRLEKSAPAASSLLLGNSARVPGADEVLQLLLDSFFDHEWRRCYFWKLVDVDDIDMHDMSIVISTTKM